MTNRTCRRCGRPLNAGRIYCSNSCRNLERYQRQNTDPTPQEIAEAAAAIREKWTAKERRKRAAGRPVVWELPVVEVDHG